MSYELVKSIKIDKQNKKVYITSACNNVIPHHYRASECTYFSNILEKDGLEEVEKEILLAYWEGNFQKSNNNYQKSLILCDKYGWDFVHGCNDDEELKTKQSVVKDYLYRNYLTYCSRKKEKVVVKNEHGNYFVKKTTRRIFSCPSLAYAKKFTSELDAKNWLWGFYSKGDFNKLSFIAA